LHWTKKDDTEISWECPHSDIRLVIRLGDFPVEHLYHISGVTRKYLVDDQTPTRYAQVAEELVSGAVLRRYTHGAQRISQTQLIGGTWTTHYYGYDGTRGSVRQLTDSAGTVTDTYTYDGFGTQVAAMGTTPNLHLYRAEQYDASLVLYYLRFRWLQPALGRFLSLDPDEGDSLLIESLNGFAYTRSDPVNGTDPSGLSPIMETALLTTAHRFGSVFSGAHLADVTAGRVTNGGRIAWLSVCCLDRAWSVLDLAVQASGGSPDPVLALITEACKLPKPCRDPKCFIRLVSQKCN
jgi:RHS repeat-associated protein